MANFIGLVYATLKNEGIDTKDMSTDEAVKKYNELQEKAGGKAGEKEGTPAEQKKLQEKGIEDKVTDDSENWESGKYTGDEARFNKIHNAFSRGKVGERATKEMLSELGINEARIKNFIMTNELFNTQQNPDTVVKIAKRIFNDGEYRK